jgi:hypothetical protein
MPSKDVYQVSASSLPELVTMLNFILTRLTDRLDKMEGVRDVSDPVYNDVAVGGDITVKDKDSNVIHSLE